MPKDNVTAGVCDHAEKFEELMEKIKALENSFRDLQRDRSSQTAEAPSASTTANPTPEPIPSDLAPSESAAVSEWPPTNTSRPVIDLRRRAYVTLQDDVRCVARLASRDQGHPHSRLGLLWDIVYRWCDGLHDLALDTWVKIIEGTGDDDDVWLWEEGDEVHVTNNLTRKSKDTVKHDFPTFLYATSVQPSIAALTLADWDQARKALQSRLDRLPLFGRHVAPAVSHFAVQLEAFVWLLLLSKPLLIADVQRGIRRPLHDDNGVLDHWLQMPLDREYYHEILDMACVGCDDFGEWYRKGKFIILLLMFGEIDDVQDIANWASPGNCFCGDYCSIQISEMVASLDIPEIDLPVVHLPWTMPSLRSLHQNQPNYGEPMRPVTLLENDFPDPDPPTSLALGWTIYWETSRFSQARCNVNDLISQIEASAGDSSDLWTWELSDEDWLRRNVTVSPPNHNFAPWVNRYPYPFRKPLTHLTLAGWERLKLSISPTPHNSTLYLAAPRLSLPKDGLLWIGIAVWAFLKKLVPGDRKSEGKVAPLDAVWFRIMWELKLVTDALNFPPTETTPVTAKFRQAIVSSGHSCYGRPKWTSYSELVVVIYAALRWRLDRNDNIPITGLETYRPVKSRYCEVCKTAPLWKPGPIRESFPSINSLEDALKVFMPVASDPMFISLWEGTYKRDTISAIANFDGFIEAEKYDCFELITKFSVYQRFFIYTFAHLKLCEDDDRLLSILKTSMAEWITWNPLSSILNHRLIFGHLWALLRATRNSGYRLPNAQAPEDFYCPHTCDAYHTLKDIFIPDILSICVQIDAILGDPEGQRFFMSRRGQEAQSLLNLLQAFLDHSSLNPQFKYRFQVALFKLSTKSGLYPDCLVLTDIKLDGNYVNGMGTFGDVRKGVLQGVTVAVKQLRINEANVIKVLKDFSHEVVIWRQLDHPNVLPFYGVYHLNHSRSSVCLVSPWMENGTINQFLDRNPTANRVVLLRDIAQGLDYLHTRSPHIIHGDLKGANVLVTPSHRACLADFGLSTAGDSRAFLQSSSSNARTTGTTRWQAPELLTPEIENAPLAVCSRTSDVYSFACVCYEVFSGKIPHYEILNHNSVIVPVCMGKRPLPLPSDLRVNRGLDDELWQFIEDCWHQSSSLRPSSTEVVGRLCKKLDGFTDSRPWSDWDSSFASRVRSNLAGHPFCPPPISRKVEGGLDEESFLGPPLLHTTKRSHEGDVAMSSDAVNKKPKVDA